MYDIEEFRREDEEDEDAEEGEKPRKGEMQ